MGFFTNLIDKMTNKTTYITGGGTRSRPYNRSIESDEICSGILDCNATHIARGQMVHVVIDADGRVQQMKRSSAYTKIFQRPNPFMTRQDFLYSMAWQLQIANVALAWVKWDPGMKPVEIWPLIYLNFEVRKTTSGGYAVEFCDRDGNHRVVLMEDLIVIRRKYDGTGFSGQGNNIISNSIEIVSQMDESLKQIAEVSNKIHGAVKQKNSMLAPNANNKNQESFDVRVKNAAKGSGFLSLDGMEEFIPLNIDTWTANAAQMKQIRERLNLYWRTPEDVVLNTATEQTMQNYYDSIVEPVWEEMAEAFTNAVFTSREQDFGNRMMVYGGAATGASWQTKLNIISNTKETGILSTNEQRELLGYAPVENGDERLVSLNYIKAKDMSKYQTGDEPDDGEEGGDDNGSGEDGTDDGTEA